jgi:hypothetical protein
LASASATASRSGREIARHAAASILPACGPGAIFLPLNTAYTVAEIDYFLGDAEPSS